jgi:predicted AlkP superfamily phosphohydrolase/phosphomutase
LDHGLGLILEQLGPDDSLFVVSDHGFQGITHVFNINEYLYSKGWLTPSSSYQYQIKQAHRYASLKQVLKRFGLLSLARRTKRKLKHAGALKVLHSDVYHPLLLDIDWERTLAYVPSLSGYPGSYVDIFLREDLDAESLIELCEDLKQQVDPRSGQSLVNALYTTEVFGEGPYAPGEPHLLLLPNDGITFRMNLGGKSLWDDASKTRGTHQKDGVLYAYGGGIKSGFKAPDAEIYDLVPTVLYSMGLPLPHTFDGRVLEELFVTDKRNEQMSATVGSDIEGGLARRKLQKLLEM